MERMIRIVMAAGLGLAMSFGGVGCAHMGGGCDTGMMGGGGRHMGPKGVVEAPPPGWECPMHGAKCPWATHRKYCHYYDMHGYRGWRGGDCCGR